MLWVVRGDGRRSWGILAGRFRRPIDPHGRGQRFWTWWPLYEPLRMGGVRRQARAVPDREDRSRRGRSARRLVSDSSGRCDGARRCTTRTDRG